MSPAIVDVMTARAVAAAIDAAVETGVMASLMEGGRSHDDLCRHHGVDGLALSRVLDVLEAGGVLEREQDAWRVADEALPYLTGVDGMVWGTMLWRHAPTFLRTGETLLPPNDLKARGVAYSEHAGSLAKKFARYARALADRLAPRMPRGALLLDVGAGSAVWSLPLLEQDTGARLVVLDLPPVVERTLAAARAAGLQDRTEAVRGDYHSAPLPRDVDVALLANVLHLESPADARALLARTAAAVRPGGLVVVIDALDGKTERAAAVRKAYALHLGMRVAGGYPHAESDLTTWLEAAGCRDVDRVTIPNSFGGALVATRGNPS